MTYLTHLQSVWARDMPALSQTARLELDLSGPLPLVAVHDPSGRTLSQAVLAEGRTLSPASFGSQSRSGDGAQRALDLAGQSRSLDGATIDRLRDSGGSVQAYLDGVPFYGNLTALHMVELNGYDILYGAPVAGSGIAAWNVWSDGRVVALDSVADADGRYLGQVSALAHARAGGQDWLLAASSGEDGVAVLRIGADGQLTHAGGMGFEERLPVDSPTMIRTANAGDVAHVFLSAHGSASLTVLELDPRGNLRFLDQVNDTLTTRFDGASAMAVHAPENGQALIAVAGHDGGVSLFQLLPTGRLVLRDTLVQEQGMALGQVAQLEFADLGNGRIELLALSTGVQGGLARMLVDDYAPGLTATGRDGLATDDVITASDAGGTRRGGDGDDVMIDGPGRDVFWGDAGADIFVFSPDLSADRIQGFDIGEDRIDLSAYPMLHDPDEIVFSYQPGGVRLRFQGDELRIHSHDGSSYGRADLTHALLFADDHVTMPPPLPNRGTSADEVFDAGMQPDTVDGGGGYDVVTFERAPASATVNLADSAANAGAAAGYRLSAIEGVTGSMYNDRLMGDGNGNLLNGLAGNDVIEGHGGADWITPGPGHDTVDGGWGTDMVSFVDMDQAVIASLDAGTVRSGPHTNVLRGIENLTGSVYGDFIQGNGNANLLRGLGDYDWFVGSWGADTIDGGTGRDMVSYVYSPFRVEVDLAAGTGAQGHAAGDSYVSVERVTGSVHSDLLIGDAGENDFRGLGGYDWFVGSPGRDRYDGGSGLDTVSYANAASGVTASLLLGRGSRGEASRDLYTDVERLTGSSHDDVLTGDHGRNVLRGMWGEDRLYGQGGVDYIEGGGRDDYIDGGAGWDYAVFSGARSEYTISRAGAATVVERIAPGGDGRDTLVNVEVAVFADGDVIL